MEDASRQKKRPPGRRTLQAAAQHRGELRIVAGEVEDRAAEDDVGERVGKGAALDCFHPKIVRRQVWGEPVRRAAGPPESTSRPDRGQKLGNRIVGDRRGYVPNRSPHRGSACPGRGVRGGADRTDRCRCRRTAPEGRTSVLDGRSRGRWCPWSKCIERRPRRKLQPVVRWLALAIRGGERQVNSRLPADRRRSAPVSRN
jgi:hypothetical protein